MCDGNGRMELENNQVTPDKPKQAIDDLETAKQFLGSLIVTRGYGQEPYDAILRTMKYLEAAAQLTVEILEGMKKPISEGEKLDWSRYGEFKEKKIWNAAITEIQKRMRGTE